MRLREALATAYWALKARRVRRRYPEWYRRLDAARLVPTRDPTSEDLTAAEERLVRRVAERLEGRVIAELESRRVARESALLFPPERSAAGFRALLLRLRRREDGDDESAA
ncbi:hypothetical protein [Streptomyces synnematoformans]|uniref:Uncharacterized protein n=1 Tax=Streptomyces synnematoformans TaxID=415721 RepID=A0ABN2YJK1_9ACTN